MILTITFKLKQKIIWTMYHLHAGSVRDGSTSSKKQINNKSQLVFGYTKFSMEKTNIVENSSGGNADMGLVMDADEGTDGGLSMDNDFHFDSVADVGDAVNTVSDAVEKAGSFDVLTDANMVIGCRSDLDGHNGVGMENDVDDCGSNTSVNVSYRSGVGASIGVTVENSIGDDGKNSIDDKGYADGVGGNIDKGYPQFVPQISHTIFLVTWKKRLVDVFWILQKEKPVFPKGVSTSSSLRKTKDFV